MLNQPMKVTGCLNVAKQNSIQSVLCTLILKENISNPKWTPKMDPKNRPQNGKMDTDMDTELDNAPKYEMPKKVRILKLRSDNLAQSIYQFKEVKLYCTLLL